MFGIDLKASLKGKGAVPGITIQPSVLLLKAGCMNLPVGGSSVLSPAANRTQPFEMQIGNAV